MGKPMEQQGSTGLPEDQETLDLMQRARTGESEALSYLLMRYEPWLRRIVRVRLGRNLRGCLESMDVVQEALIVASSKLTGPELQSAPAVRRWLAGVVTNVLHDKADYFFAQKRDARLRVSTRSESSEDAPGNFIDEGTGVQTRAERAEISEIMDEIIAGLQDAQREVILLRDYARMDWTDIKDALGKVSVPAAKQLHQRAWINVRREARNRMQM